MEFPGVASVTHTPAPQLYGSWFTDSSTPRAGGFRASIPLLCAAVCTQSMTTSFDTKAGASSTFPLFEKERPLASTVKEWIEQSESLLPADQRALVDGRLPRTLLQYRSVTVPPSLVLRGRHYGTGRRGTGSPATEHGRCEYSKGRPEGVPRIRDPSCTLSINTQCAKAQCPAAT